MLTRRGFIGVAGSAMATIAGTCYPPLPTLADGFQEAPVDRLQALSELARRKDRLLGYPINMNTPAEGFFEWRKQLMEAGVGVFAYNNVGNPFKASPIPFNTHEYERRIIAAIGRRLKFPADDNWGFLSHSGTDSNMHGMYMGRTLLEGRTGTTPKAYFTREAHYSVEILADLLGLQAVYVDTLPDGGADPVDLLRQVQANSPSPALVVATIGTTFKGAIDNVDRIREQLGTKPYYLHLDAALFGGYLPFTKHASEVAMIGKLGQQRYDSLAISCHKFFGFPSPAGLFLTTRQGYDEFNELFGRIHNPEYIHHTPGTITCSRDAVKPGEFYYFTKPEAQVRQVEDAGRMLENATYLKQQLDEQFPAYDAQRSNPLSNTVYFRHPGDRVVDKYSLATMKLTRSPNDYSAAHVVVMPHVDRRVLDEFLADLPAKPTG